MENPINHRNFEGIVVNLVDSSAVAQAKRSRPGFGPFERLRFCSFLIFKSCVFLSMIVNEFKFVYLACFSVFHSPSQVWDSLGCNFAGLWILRTPATVIGSCCRC